MIEAFFKQLQQTPLLEWIAVLCGVAQVILAYKNKVSNFFFGAISTLLFTFLFFKYQLLGESILNIYYLIMSVYGIFYWGKGKTEIAISRSSKKDYSISILIAIVSAIALLAILRLGYGHLERINYADAFVSALAFAGTYLLLKRKVETWILLNISNIVAIPVQLYKGMYLTAVLTTILFIVAVMGYFAWRKELVRKLSNNF